MKYLLVLCLVMAGCDPRGDMCDSGKRAAADIESCQKIAGCVITVEEIRWRNRKLANICEATMIRVVELEREAASLIEIAKKLRAAVVANT